MTPDELIERAAQAMYYAGPRDKSFDKALGLRGVYLDRAAKAVRVALEEAAAAVYSETIDTPQHAEAHAHNDAIRSAVFAIRTLLPQEDGE